MSEVEVNEVLGFMGNEATKIPTHDAMPGRPESVVKLLLDMLCDVLLYVPLLHSFLCNFNGILLHRLGHVGRLDHGLHLRTGAVVVDHCFEATCWGIRRDLD